MYNLCKCKENTDKMCSKAEIKYESLFVFVPEAGRGILRWNPGIISRRIRQEVTGNYP
jgi:hypothetical protein